MRLPALSPAASAARHDRREHDVGAPGVERDPRCAVEYAEFPDVRLPVFPSATSDIDGAVADGLVPPPVHGSAARLIDTERVEANDRYGESGGKVDDSTGRTQG